MLVIVKLMTNKRRAATVGQECVFMNNVLGSPTKLMLGMKCVIKNTISVDFGK